MEHIALSEPYGEIMLAPGAGAGVCATCFNLIDPCYERCFACSQNESWLGAVAPISYSIAREPLHRALAGYKRSRSRWARRLTAQLAAVLWRYLERHEDCVARRAGVAGFDLVTTVPAGTADRDERQPLRQLVVQVEPVQDRLTRLLVRTGAPAPAHHFDPGRFAATAPLNGEAILLLDDTWTTGASAQSAAAVLRSAGAATVAAVVIGRHLNRPWRFNQERLPLPGPPFAWERCGLCPTPALAALTP